MRNFLMWMRDNRKISILGSLLLMGLTIITGAAVYGVMRQQIELSLGRGLGVALQGKGNLLESQIEKSLSDTEAMAMHPALIQLMQQLNVFPNERNVLEDLEKNIQSLMQVGFTAAIVYDSQGKKLSKIGEFSQHQKQSLALNGYVNTFLIWDDQLILHANRDVFDQYGQRIGSITTEIALPQLTRSFGEIRSIGKTGVFILCAPPRNGEKNIACLISQLDGIRFKYLKHVVEEGVFPMNYALDGRKGVVAVKDYRHVAVIEAYAPLQALGLGMILKLDKEELYKSVSDQLIIVILYLAGLIAAEILLLNWFIRKLINSEQEAQSARQKAEQFSHELARKELELRERLKEITCLYKIRNSIGTESAMDNICHQIFKYLIPAMQYPEDASVVIEIDGKQIRSANHQSDQTHALRSDIIVTGKTCGHLSVFYPNDKSFLVLEEQKLIDAITDDIVKWLERKQIDETLQIRLKEMTCLYEIRRGMGLELSEGIVCRNIVKQLVSAMQFPEIATVEIKVGDNEYTSEVSYPQLADTHAFNHHANAKICYDCYRHGATVGTEVQSDLAVHEKICGFLRVSYPEDKPFMVVEEQKLVDAIAVDLSRWLERKQVDDMLQERLKEMTCLYEIRRGMGMELSLDNVCRNIFKHLIPAMRFPENVTAVIELDGWRYTSGKYNHGFVNPNSSKIFVADEIRGPWRAEREAACTGCALISVSGKLSGHLRVFYPVDKPFLVQEEKKLINAIASDLEIWLERKRLEQALIFVAEEQAHTLGQELHDNLGQQIAAIGYQARALEKKIDASGSKAMASVAASIATQAQTAVVQIKQLAQGLLPFELEANGLITALEKLAARIVSTYGIDCEFLCKHKIAINDKNIALNLYRITQEAVNNAIRHGGARYLTISLSLEKENMLVLSICDDGCGFRSEVNHDETPGMGIKIMLYRAKQLGAKLKFLPRAEGGTEVCLKMGMI
jgi:signal transduction histidine kinase